MNGRVESLGFECGTYRVLLTSRIAQRTICCLLPTTSQRFHCPSQ